MAGATSVATSHPGGGAQRSSVATQPQGGGQKALGGFTWWLLLALCNVLVTAGIGLTATVAGSIVGIPLAAFAWIVGVLVSFNAFMFAMGYYLFNKVPLMGARKLATQGISIIIELIPLVSVLPMMTISFLIITITENLKRGKGMFGGVAGKVVAKVAAKTPIGRAAVVLSKTPVGRVAERAILGSSSMQSPVTSVARPQADGHIRTGQTGKEWIRAQGGDRLKQEAKKMDEERGRQHADAPSRAIRERINAESKKQRAEDATKEMRKSREQGGTMKTSSESAAA